MKKPSKLLRAGIGALTGLSGVVSASCESLPQIFNPCYQNPFHPGECCIPTKNPEDITELTTPCTSEPVNLNWIYENCWFDNQVDLRVIDGRIESRKLAGLDSFHKPNVSSEGRYALIVENSDGNPVYASRINLIDEFTTAHWPARGDQFRMRVQDENCETLFEEKVWHIALRY